MGEAIAELCVSQQDDVEYEAALCDRFSSNVNVPLSRAL